MIRCHDETVARDFARERGMSYGWSVFSDAWFVGGRRELRDVGVIKPLSVGLAAVGQSVIDDLRDEVESARRKFPGNRFLLAALMEEVGELAQAYLQRQGPERIRKEAIQVACVAIRIIEEGDSSFVDLTDEEAKQ